MTQNFEIDDAMLDRISAYVDGEVTQDEARDIELLATLHPNIQAEIDALRDLDRKLIASFDAVLDDPVPDLGSFLPSVDIPEPANSNSRSRWGDVSRLIAASVILLAIGAGAGSYITQTMAPVQVAANRGWMADIADYHRVYANQSRHLVEVPASEKAHIEAWLSKTIGVPLSVPDLAADGFEFQGARLLVATGKPVAQLMYRNAAGVVVAICGLKTDAFGNEGFLSRQFSDVQMVRWDRAGASFVVVGDKGTELQKLAETASLAL